MQSCENVLHRSAAISSTTAQSYILMLLVGIKMKKTYEFRSNLVYKKGATHLSVFFLL